MILWRQPDEVTAWLVAFCRVGRYRGARLVPGPFKHVAAIGWSDRCRTWVIYDVTLAGTRLYVLPDGPSGWPEIARWLGDTEAVLVSPKPALRRRSPWLGFWCVPAVRHLVGCRCGAWTPTGLYHGLIAEGAVVVRHGIDQHLRPARPT